MISQYLARIGRIAVPMMIFSVLIGLGLWQLDRAEQKRARADTYADRMSAAPIALEAWLDAGLEDVRWRRVSVHGRFGEQVLVLDNRVLDGRLGVEVLSPFELESGRTVLVNRGWVPTSAQRSVAPVVDTPRTPLTITGHAGPVPVTGLKLNAQADSFDILAPAMARVQNIDLAAISSRYDLTLLPYVVYLNEDSPAGFVRRWKTPGDGSEKHRAYAVQWFAMAGILMVIYFILRRAKARSVNNESGRDGGSPGRGGIIRSRLVMLGLVAIFVVPIAIAWLYAAGYFELGDWGRSNRGSLITPPIDLRDVAAVAPLFDRADLKPGEWAVLYLSAARCEQACLAALDRLSTIKSVLGYAGQRVRVLSLTGAEEIVAQEEHAFHRMADPSVFAAIAERLVARAPAASTEQIVLIDWRRQVVLRYAQEAPPIDIKKDLKRLFARLEDPLIWPAGPIRAHIKMVYTRFSPGFRRAIRVSPVGLAARTFDM